MTTSSGKNFCRFSVFKDACFNGSVVIHVSSLYKNSCKSSPEDRENSSNEDAEWGNTVLEVEISLGMANRVVESPFTWLFFDGKDITWKEFVVTLR